MSTQHTPGPWFLVGNEIHDREAKYDASGARTGSTPNSIASVHIYPQTPISKGSQEANARLIAAAPELLAALIKAVSRQGFTNEELFEARAAIAKAKGQQ